MSLQIGQKVRINLIGMRVRDLDMANHRVEATVVGLAPGVITVRFETKTGKPSEITVSPERIER